LKRVASGEAGEIGNLDIALLSNSVSTVELRRREAWTFPSMPCTSTPMEVVEALSIELRVGGDP
jgi:hypothetical protein